MAQNNQNQNKSQEPGKRGFGSMDEEENRRQSNPSQKQNQTGRREESESGIESDRRMQDR